MQLEKSEKIRRENRNPVMRLLARLITVCLIIVGSFGSLNAQERHQVALFDFDKREVTPDPLARHIETMLRKTLPNIELDHYSGLGDESHSVKMLHAIESKGYDLIITRTSDALILAQHTLFQTPTLYTNVNNPLLLGFRTLGAPGGNISGASYYIPIAKHLRIYKTILPTLQKPGFIFDKHNKSRKVEVPETRRACSALGLKYEMEFVDNRNQLPKAAHALLKRGVDAIVAASSGTIYEHIGSFLDTTNRHGIPVFSFYKHGVTQGAVVALSSDYFRLAEELLLPMAVRVLKDKVSPGQMPAAFLQKNELFVNRKQARSLGLTIPKELEQEHDVVYVE
jgi:ABC-type uncharacterized transport system substrate-binding protein